MLRSQGYLAPYRYGLKLRKVVFYFRKPAVAVEWRYTEEGKKVRVVLPSEVELPLPIGSQLLDDGVDPEGYIGETKYLQNLNLN